MIKTVVFPDKDAAHKTLQAVLEASNLFHNAAERASALLGYVEAKSILQAAMMNVVASGLGDVVTRNVSPEVTVNFTSSDGFDLRHHNGRYSLTFESINDGQLAQKICQVLKEVRVAPVEA